MIYKFKSPASGDVIMLGPNGDQMLRLIGREPAPKGIIEPAAMDAAIAALQPAVASDEQAASSGDEADSADEKAHRAVGLRQRLWPMVEMLRRSRAAGEAVVWGV